MYKKRALVDNLADEEQVGRAEEKEKLLKETLEEDMKTMLSMPEGRRVLWHYISFCGVFRSFMQEQSAMYYSAGQRNVGLKILDDCTTIDPNYMGQMIKDELKER